MSTRPPSLIFRGSSNSTLTNEYVPGSGVGSRSIAVRRALSRRASTPRDPIPIIITESNNNLILILGGQNDGSGGSIVDTINITPNTYNTTTFTTVLNNEISSEFQKKGLLLYAPSISYSTTSKKFTFNPSVTAIGIGLRIKDCTMKSVLGFNTFDEVYDSFPIPPSDSFSSQVEVNYRP